jgi:hypothetical protein
MASTTLTTACADASLPAVGMAPPLSAILSLDLGTTMGWAVRMADGAIHSGAVSFRPSRYDGGGMRYLRFRSWLDGLARDAGGPGAVYFEEVRRHVGTDAAHLCQSARKTDPRSASKNDPPDSGRRSALAGRSWSGLRSPASAGWKGRGADQARFLKRQLSLPVSTMSQ